MDQPGGVDLPQGFGHFGHQPENIRGRHGAVALHLVGYGDAVDELHGDPWPFGVGVGIQHSRDMRSAHAACRLDLAGEPRPERPVVRSSVHDLDGDHTVCRGRRTVDGAHPTTAEDAHLGGIS